MTSFTSKKGGSEERVAVNFLTAFPENDRRTPRGLGGKARLPENDQRKEDSPGRLPAFEEKKGRWTPTAQNTTLRIAGNGGGKALILAENHSAVAHGL